MSALLYHELPEPEWFEEDPIPPTHSCPQCGSDDLIGDRQVSEDRSIGYSELREIARCRSCGFEGEGEEFELRGAINHPPTPPSRSGAKKSGNDYDGELRAPAVKLAPFSSTDCPF